MADFMPRGAAIREALANRITTTKKAKKARWERKNKIRPFRVGSPDTSSWVEGDPTMSATIQALAARAAPAVAASINRHYLPVFQAAQDAWPIRSGASRSALVLEYELLDSQTLSAKIRSPADYTWFIKSDGVHIPNALIIKPGKVAIDRMADDISATLGA